MDHRAVILNNRICLPGSHARESVSRGKLDYLTQREGVVQEPTEDDILRQKQNEILGKLDYVAHRKGAVFEPGTNCALFDQSGVLGTLCLLGGKRCAKSWPRTLEQ